MDTVQNPQSIPSVTPAPIPPSSSPWTKPVLIVLAIASALVLGLMALFLITNKPYQVITSGPTRAPRQAVTVSGQVYFQGYAPAGSYISLAERTEGHGQFKEVVTGLSAANGITKWSWTDSTKGQNYEMKALLKVQGKTLQESPIQDVSAPATNVALVVVSQQTPPTPVAAAMNGQVNLDGYVPAGASLQIFAQQVGTGSFQQIANGIVAVDNAAWSWTTASSGATYMVKAQLVDANSNVISTGDTQTAAAPASGLLLNVYSTAKPSAPTASGISGNITINGNIPGNSYITLGVRPTGTTSFNQVTSNIAATNGVGFSWNDASSGQQYDVQAYLWVDSKPYAQSQILTVTAPSTFDSLTINAQQPLQAPPSSTLTVSCGPQQSGNFQATINYNMQGNLVNVKSYNIVVTLASQNSQTINTTISPANPTSPQNLTTTYVFSPSATYYAQYAYSTDGSTYSPLSPSVQFACR